MQIALIAVGGRRDVPNLELMHLSTWHKRQGDVVDWWNGFERYDRSCLWKEISDCRQVCRIIVGHEQDNMTGVALVKCAVTQSTLNEVVR